MQLKFMQLGLFKARAVRLGPQPPSLRQSPEQPQRAKLHQTAPQPLVKQMQSRAHMLPRASLTIGLQQTALTSGPRLSQAPL